MVNYQIYECCRTKTLKEEDHLPMMIILKRETLLETAADLMLGD